MKGKLFTLLNIVLTGSAFAGHITDGNAPQQLVPAQQSWGEWGSQIDVFTFTHPFVYLTYTIYYYLKTNKEVFMQILDSQKNLKPAQIDFALEPAWMARMASIYAKTIYLEKMKEYSLINSCVDIRSISFGDLVEYLHNANEPVNFYAFEALGLKLSAISSEEQAVEALTMLKQSISDFKAKIQNARAKLIEKIKAAQIRSLRNEFLKTDPFSLDKILELIEKHLLPNASIKYHKRWIENMLELMDSDRDTFDDKLLELIEKNHETLVLARKILSILQDTEYLQQIWY